MESNGKLAELCVFDLREFNPHAVLPRVCILSSRKNNNAHFFSRDFVRIIINILLDFFVAEKNHTLNLFLIEIYSESQKIIKKLLKNFKLTLSI